MEKTNEELSKLTKADLIEIIKSYKEKLDLNEGCRDILRNEPGFR